MTTVLHVSDLHFGRPQVAEQIAGVERIAHEQAVDAIAISGDVSQRGRSSELRRGQEFLRRLAEYKPTIVVPGNHDVRWWWSPLGIFGTGLIYRQYRRFIAAELEPVLRIPGVTLVGLNSAHGVMPWTLTKRVRDIGVIGFVAERQIEYARAQFAQSPPTDYRVLVVHHNLTRGDLSRRYGVKHPQRVLDAVAGLGVELVLSGHDHQEAIHHVKRDGLGIVVATAGTVSRRSRGGRASSVHLMSLEPHGIVATTATWSKERGAFVSGEPHLYARDGRG